jgi:hypothetical protein
VALVIGHLSIPRQETPPAALLRAGGPAGAMGPFIGFRMPPVGVEQRG